MKRIIWVIDEENKSACGGEGILPLLQGEKAKIILVGLLPTTKTEEEKEREVKIWHSLFSLMERLIKEGFSVSVSAERGTPFSLLNLMDTLDAQMLLLPKEKFLLLGPLENDDFLNRLSCPLLLY
ncbi:MAG: hypothetical protein ABIK81_02340 [candidate division WOR-3 bacterium]